MKKFQLTSILLIAGLALAFMLSNLFPFCSNANAYIINFIEPVDGNVQTVASHLGIYDPEEHGLGYLYYPEENSLEFEFMIEPEYSPVITGPTVDLQIGVSAEFTLDVIDHAESWAEAEMSFDGSTLFSESRGLYFEPSSGNEELYLFNETFNTSVEVGIEYLGLARSFIALTVYDGYALAISSLQVNFEILTEETPPPTAPVPEPATVLLFGTGLVGLAGLRRKKSKSNLPI